MHHHYSKKIFLKEQGKRKNQGRSVAALNQTAQVWSCHFKFILLFAQDSAHPRTQSHQQPASEAATPSNPQSAEVGPRGRRPGWTAPWKTPEMTKVAAGVGSLALGASAQTDLGGKWQEEWGRRATSPLSSFSPYVSLHPTTLYMIQLPHLCFGSYLRKGSFLDSVLRGPSLSKVSDNPTGGQSCL